MNKQPRKCRVPVAFKHEVMDTLNLDEFDADRFVKAFLGQFDDPESWLKTLDPETTRQSITRFHRRRFTRRLRM